MKTTSKHENPMRIRMKTKILKTEIVKTHTPNRVAVIFANL